MQNLLVTVTIYQRTAEMGKTQARRKNNFISLTLPLKKGNVDYKLSQFRCKYTQTLRFPMVSLELCHLHNPSGRTMALGLTQPLTEMSTGNISWVGVSKRGRCLRLTILPPSCADCLEIWTLQPSGTLRATPVLYPSRFTFI